jgi:hypothetical protein
MVQSAYDASTKLGRQTKDNSMARELIYWAGRLTADEDELTQRTN